MKELTAASREMLTKEEWDLAKPENQSGQFNIGIHANGKGVALEWADILLTNLEPVDVVDGLLKIVYVVPVELRHTLVFS